LLAKTLGGQREMLRELGQPSASLILNYAENGRWKLMAGILRSSSNRGTAQHSRK
jgi:hypothetical protein